ncbi:MAG TPA: 3-dehydroquinate synthase [Chlamydiales bacterium]|nr:3-dehydroquinate synthase [Chlamydiales bacterium]
MKKILIRPSTELYIGCNLLIPEVIELCNNLRIVLIADAAIKDLYAVDLAKKIDAELLTIPNGERAKVLETVQNLIDEFCKMGCGRDTLLVALGGGVTTDLVGFVASIYMRGLPLILIPTTLLAIVDAAIGGKTAIDTAYGKNLIGTIYYPKAIFADLDMLQTLPEKEWFNGLAEILKMGLIYETAIWEMAKKNGKDPDLILKAIQGKIAIVEQDPTEQGLRRILNFGHTVGHALETLAQYAMPHGETVALGCAVEAHLSMRLGYLPEKDFEQILGVYSRFPLKLPLGYARTKFLSAMAHDKKKALGEIRFVLIDKIGHAIPFEGAYCRTVTQSELEPTLDWMENWKSFH